MVTESSVHMLSNLGSIRQTLAEGGVRGSNGNFEDRYGKELEMILREHRNREISDREKELNLYRSGSAPPTVDGSLSAVGSLFWTQGARHIPSAEALQSHPDYPSYYYSREDLNPRFPPPMLSKENWSFARRLQAGAGPSLAPTPFGGIGDRRKKDLVDDDDDGSSRSLFSSPPGIPLPKGDGDLMDSRKVGVQRTMSRQPSKEWLEQDADGLIGLSGVGLGARRKSLADMLQVPILRMNIMM